MSAAGSTGSKGCVNREFCEEAENALHRVPWRKRSLRRSILVHVPNGISSERHLPYLQEVSEEGQMKKTSQLIRFEKILYDRRMELEAAEHAWQEARKAVAAEEMRLLVQEETLKASHLEDLGAGCPMEGGRDLIGD